MEKLRIYRILGLFTLCLFFLNSCGGNFFRGADARKVSPDPRERVKKKSRRRKGI